MSRFSEFFSLLSDETRLRCLALLVLENELCVCEITHTLAISQPKVSRHLSILRNSKLVLCERRGQWIYYKLNRDYGKNQLDLLLDFFDKMKRVEPFVLDADRLKDFRIHNTC